MQIECPMQACRPFKSPVCGCQEECTELSLLEERQANPGRTYADLRGLWRADVCLLSIADLMLDLQMSCSNRSASLLCRSVVSDSCMMCMRRLLHLMHQCQAASGHFHHAAQLHRLLLLLGSSVVWAVQVSIHQFDRLLTWLHCSLWPCAPLAMQRVIIT